jgi:hypothetical protein
MLTSVVLPLEVPSRSPDLLMSLGENPKSFGLGMAAPWAFLPPWRRYLGNVGCRLRVVKVGRWLVLVFSKWCRLRRVDGSATFFLWVCSMRLPVLQIAGGVEERVSFPYESISHGCGGHELQRLRRFPTCHRCPCWCPAPSTIATPVYAPRMWESGSFWCVGFGGVALVSALGCGQYLP